MFTVYVITCIVNDKKYVGYTKKSHERRLDEHIEEANKNSSRLLCKAIRKYGPGAFVVNALHETSCRDEAQQLEIESIAALDTFNNGYNMTTGGDGGATITGWALSDAWRTNISKALTGRTFSDAHRKNLSENHADVSGENNPFYGCTHTKESKRKIANRPYTRGKAHHWYGKVTSGAFSVGNHPRATKVTIDGVEYSSMRQAMIATGLSKVQVTKIRNAQLKDQS